MATHWPQQHADPHEISFPITEQPCGTSLIPSMYARLKLFVLIVVIGDDGIRNFCFSCDNP